MDDIDYEDLPPDFIKYQPEDEEQKTSGDQAGGQEDEGQSPTYADAEAYPAEPEMQPPNQAQPIPDEDQQLFPSAEDAEPLIEAQPPVFPAIDNLPGREQDHPLGMSELDTEDKTENIPDANDEQSPDESQPERAEESPPAPGLEGALPEEGFRPQDTAATEIPPTEPADLPSEQEAPQPVGEESAPSAEETLAAPGSMEQFSLQDFTLLSPEEVPAEANPKKVALVLSGGGARGAFQVGAEKYAREVKGYQWDIIAGVSVGAMNGAMLAMHRFARLLELWDNISDDQVYTGGFNLVSLIKILCGAKSFYGNEPLLKLMQREFEAGRILDDLHVGVVSLTSGEYVQFTRQSLELSKAILASASIPVVWPPVDVSPDYPAMVDGGVRNITPIGDVLELEPDEIVIINCASQQPPPAPNAAANVLSIGMRTLDIMQNEIFINDMKAFLRINALVKEADQQGATLHHPKTGRALKYYPCQVIEPDIELGEVLDFSRPAIQAGLRAGVRRAREVLGRP